MGFLDRLRKKAGDVEDKASELVGEHGDKIHEGIEKAADFADEKTKGKYSEKIDKVEQQASDLVDKVKGSGEPPEPKVEVDPADAPDTAAGVEDDTAGS